MVNERWRDFLMWYILPVRLVIPLVIAEYAMGKRSRTGTIGFFRIFAGPSLLGWGCE